MRGAELIEATIVSGGEALCLGWDDGFSETLPAIWFCDNADAAFDGATGQRRQSLSELDFDTVLESVTLEGDALVLRLRGGRAARIARRRLQTRRGMATAPGRWLVPDRFRSLAPVFAEAFLNQDDVLREALSRLAGLGLVLLTGAEASAGVVERLVARFGFIRQTNYGWLFDVRSEPVPSNLAFTAQALDMHTDNPYREPVPTLQLLHAIRSDEQGGETCFVDGLAHAEAMAREEPQAFVMLAGQAVDFRYAAPDGAIYQARRPVIACDADGAPQAIHLNHRSLAPLAMEAGMMADWYAAYGAFHRRVHRPEARFCARLRPGDVALFDNRRILHGRTAFRAGAGGRWLQGCYADVDGALATLARLGGLA